VTPALLTPGRRNRPTIEDVAELAGVSRGTVSRVLNGGRHVRPAVMASVNSAIETLGYSVNQAARNLAAGRTGSVAFVISEGQERLFEDPNFGMFVKVFTRELRLQGRHLLVTAAGDHEEEAFLGNYLSAGHVDGNPGKRGLETSAFGGHGPAARFRVRAFLGCHRRRGGGS
jgi:DNA-binding LacI/PurR family transcriptional regulator